jgi:hypothetical protein
MHVEPNRVLLMDAHYINTAQEAVQPEVRINLYTIPPSQMRAEGDLLWLYNWFIKVPALGKSTARMRCTFNSDITLTNFQSHMHARGVGYEASLGTDAPFYTNTAWANVPVELFPGGTQIKAGTIIDFQCHYASTQAHDIYQGNTTKDEMCMGLGSYYPVDRLTSLCAADPSNLIDTLGLGGDWVGNGTQTCAQSMACLGAASGLQAITECVLDADPSVSKELSAVVRCNFLNQTTSDTACATQRAACNAK